jgi:hypothetical protein
MPADDNAFYGGLQRSHPDYTQIDDSNSRTLLRLILPLVRIHVLMVSSVFD